MRKFAIKVFVVFSFILFFALIFLPLLENLKRGRKIGGHCKKPKILLKKMTLELL